MPGLKVKLNKKVKKVTTESKRDKFKKGKLTKKDILANVRGLNCSMPENKKYMNFIGSGSWMLDLALTGKIGNAYPTGRVINIVGDYSTGKTLLACELINNVHWENKCLPPKKRRKLSIYYDEREYAFDMDLAEEFNMPLKEINGLKERLPKHKKAKGDFKPSDKVEDLFTNLTYICDVQDKAKKADKFDEIIYVIDSLDSLPDSREIKHIEKKGIESQDYGGGKAGQLSKMFRNLIKRISDCNITFVILSQIRMKYNVTFGNPSTRNGGKALDHYASQIFWLHKIKDITNELGFVQGITVKIHVDKNKISSKYSDLEFNIYNTHGIDNYSSAILFLKKQGVLQMAGPYLVWNDNNILEKELIQLLEDNPDEEEYLKNLLQNTFTAMAEASKLDRKPKYGPKSNIAINKRRKMKVS